MSKVFLTGADGFTGIYLEKALLHRGYEVCFDNSLDIRNLNSCQEVLSGIEPDYVIHLAGISFVAHDDVGEIYDVNLRGALNILEALCNLDHKVKKVILPSTANVYGRPVMDVVDETHPISAVNHYGASKAGMELMAEQFYSELPIVIVRPFNYTGPGQSEKFIVPKLVAAYKSGEPKIKMGNLDIVRDFSSIEYVVDAYLALMESEVHSDVFNLCSGMGVSLEEIIEKLEKLSGHQAEIVQVAEFIRKNDIKVLVGSNEKLHNAVGEIRVPDIDAILKGFFEDNS